MVDRYTAEKNFDYEINANKVINNDRDIPQRDNEPNGEPETLVGKNLHKFGDLVVKEKPPSSLQRKKNKSKIEQLIQQRTQMNRNNTNIPNKKQLIDTSTNELLLYKPKTKDTTKDIIINCEADNLVLSRLPFPKNWETQTEPPPARADKSAIIRRFTSLTMETPDIAASPTLDTITVSSIPTINPRICSNSRGNISLFKSLFENTTTIVLLSRNTYKSLFHLA